MASRIEITESEILSELQRVGSAPADAMTQVELAEATGWSRAKVRVELAKLSRAGRLVVHRVVRRKTDGHSQIVPAYTVAPKRRTKQ